MNKYQEQTLLNFMNKAKSFLERQILTDAILLCEGQVTPIHKLILAVSSPYFKDYIMKNNYPLTIISIDFMTFEVLQVILNYFYTGNIIIKQQSPKLLKSIAEASAVLQIPMLQEYCLELLLNKKLQRMSLSDWKVIEEQESKVLSDIFVQHMVQKLPFLNKTEDFLQLSIDQINVLLQCPAVAEADQNTILKSILQWIKYNLDERKEQLTQLLEKYVNIERLNPALLSELENEQLLIENTYFVAGYLKLISKRMSTETKPKIEVEAQLLNQMEVELQHVPETSESFLQHVTVAENDKLCVEDLLLKRQFFIYDCKSKLYDESHIFIYDYGEDQLLEMIIHPVANKANATIFYHEGTVYILGGRSWSSRWTFRTLFSYNFTTKLWLDKKKMNKSRHRGTVAELNGYFYVIGGTECGKTVISTERYDPAKDEWITTADLPDVCNYSNIPAVAFNDCLYTLIRSKLYKYNPQEDKWQLENFEIKKHLHTDTDIFMSKGNEKIFIIESESPKAVWIYDPKEKSLQEDIIPSALKECDGILNLEIPGNVNFLVSGSDKWFIYRPLFHSWIPFKPKRLKEFDVSMLTILPS